MSDKLISSTPAELIISDKDSFESKVDRFAKAGASAIHAVFDFDRTLTIKNFGTDDEVTTWHILREHLPEEGKIEYDKMFDRYRSLELSGDMTKKDAIEWWSGILSLFVRHEISLGDVESTFMDRANIRPGVRELFNVLSDAGIPIVILSAGIRDVIELWCKKYEVNPSLVISTSLSTDENNRISGWKRETLVHILNKSEAQHDELNAIRNERPFAILVGDSINDASMAAGEAEVIRVRIVDQRDDEQDLDYEKKTFEKFDALIRSGDLHPLVSLVDVVI